MDGSKQTREGGKEAQGLRLDTGEPLEQAASLEPQRQLSRLQDRCLGRAISSAAGGRRAAGSLVTLWPTHLLSIMALLSHGHLRSAACQAAEPKQGQGSPCRTSLPRRFPWVLGLPRYFPVFEPGVEDFALGSKGSHRVKMEREKGQTKQNKTLERAGRQNSTPLKLPSSDRADTSLYSLVGHI